MNGTCMHIYYMYVAYIYIMYLFSSTSVRPEAPQQIQYPASARLPSGAVIFHYERE